MCLWLVALGPGRLTRPPRLGDYLQNSLRDRLRRSPANRLWSCRDRRLVLRPAGSFGHRLPGYFGRRLTGYPGRSGAGSGRGDGTSCPTRCPASRPARRPGRSSPRHPRSYGLQRPARYGRGPGVKESRGLVAAAGDPRTEAKSQPPRTPRLEREAS